MLVLGDHFYGFFDMRKAFVFFFGFLFFLVANAQKIYEPFKIDEIHLKPEMQKNANPVYLTKVGEDYLVLKTEPVKRNGVRHYLLETFDAELNSGGSQELEGPFTWEDYLLRDIIELGDHCVFFTTKHFPTEKKVNLYFQRFNLKTRELESRQLCCSSGYEVRWWDINYTMTTDLEHRGLLITARQERDEPTMQEVDFYVFDEQMQLFWEYKNIIENKYDLDYKVHQALLGNEGQIYILRRKKGEVRAYSNYVSAFELVRLTEGGEEVLLLESENYFFDSSELILNEDGTIHVLGYYRTEGVAGVDGVFLTSINTEFIVERKILSEFSEVFISQRDSDISVSAGGERQNDEKEIGLLYLKLSEVVKHEDGSMSIIGEIVVSPLSADANGRIVANRIRHSDLIVSRISESGTMNTRVNRGHENLSGFGVLNINNEVCLFYNSSRRDVAKTDLQLSTVGKSAFNSNVLALVQISETGEIAKSCIIDYRSPKYAGIKEYANLTQNVRSLKAGDRTEVVLRTVFGKGDFGFITIQFE